uniref:Kaptin (actin binding protein) n=1 Tax=Sinocyclocheilus rhinocerous TaxID=307959 RepID=A0A673NQY5_9TELE
MLPDIKGTCPLVEDSFSRFPSQSNIYGLCKADEQELLATPLKGKVVYKATPFLNIYCDYEPGSKFNLESIAQSCLNLALQFTLFQLYHIEYVIVSSETVFLLSGNDQCIHLYKENASLHQFEEQPVERLFPELQELPSNVLWLNVLSIEQNRRLIAFGCQNGSVGLSLVNQKGPEILQNWRVKHDSPICTVLLFPSKQQHQSTDTKNLQTIVIESSLFGFFPHRDVEKYGLSRQLCLAESGQCDAVLCALVADLDFDGQHELLLGTYGQDLLCYKFHQPMGAFEDKLQLLWRRSFKSPLLSLIYLDLDGDGLRELAVLTLKGLHILQHSQRTTADLVLHILSTLVSRLPISSKDPHTHTHTRVQKSR